MKNVAAVTIVAVAAVASLGACGSDHPKDCRTRGGATICLVKSAPHAFEPTASGLKPGSTAQLSLAGPQVDKAQGPAPTQTVDANGHLPTGTAVVVPAGTGGVTITITATTASGKSITVTFRK
jgi:hypothetical protein